MFKIKKIIATLLAVAMMASVGTSVMAEEVAGCSDPNCANEHLTADSNGNADITFNIFEDVDGNVSVLNARQTQLLSTKQIPVGTFSLHLRGWTGLTNAGTLSWELTSTSPYMKRFSSDIFVNSTNALNPISYKNSHLYENFLDFSVYHSGMVGKINFMLTETSLKVGFTNLFISFVATEAMHPGLFSIVHRG